MSLDAQITRLTQFGRITIDAEQGILIEGFEGENATCRDAAVLAMLWGIAELQRDIYATIQSPGEGDAVIN
jgi:hypothetical protein